jgi:YesN/AraC family two-component response regulator
LEKEINKIARVETLNITDKIYLIGDKQVMLDSDLAEIYGVETKRVNEAVKNNPKKFPSDFYFELDNNEFESLRSKISTTTLKSNLSTSRFTKTRTNPNVFTEQVFYMLATILKSETAIDVTVAIMRTFVNMRSFLTFNASIFQRLVSVETKQIQYQIQTDLKISKIFKALENKEIKPTEGIFYNGQIFDAWQFVSSLIKVAKESIILIDNYIDESVLTL